jgi:hypothetical protein
MRFAIFACAALHSACTIEQVDVFANEEAQDAAFTDVSAAGDAGVMNPTPDAGRPLVLRCPKSIAATAQRVGGPLQDLRDFVKVAVAKEWAWALTDGSLTDVVVATWHWPSEAWTSERRYEHDGNAGFAQLAPHGDDRVSIVTMAGDSTRRKIVTRAVGDIRTDQLPELEIEPDERLAGATKTEDAHIFAVTSSAGGVRLVHVYDTGMRAPESNSVITRGAWHVVLASVEPAVWLWIFERSEASTAISYLRFLGAEREESESVHCPGAEKRPDLAAVGSERFWIYSSCADGGVLESFTLRMSQSHFKHAVVPQEYIALAYDGLALGALAWMTGTWPPQMRFYEPQTGELISSAPLLSPAELPPTAQLVAADLAGVIAGDGVTTNWVAAFLFRFQEGSSAGFLYTATFSGCRLEPVN